MLEPAPALPDVLAGLAPARSASCPRCGNPTQALANGRGRLDICATCGSFELVNPEGIEIFSMRSLRLPQPRKSEE